MALSIRNYALCNQINLSKYYNTKDGNRLICRLCGENRKASPLRCCMLSDDATRWYYCPECGFSGTATEYIARAEQKNIDDILQPLNIDPAAMTAYAQYRLKEKRIREKFMTAEHYMRTSNIQVACMFVTLDNGSPVDETVML